MFWTSFLASQKPRLEIASSFAHLCVLACFFCVPFVEGPCRVARRSGEQRMACRCRGGVRAAAAARAAGPPGRRHGRGRPPRGPPRVRQCCGGRPAVAAGDRPVLGGAACGASRLLFSSGEGGGVVSGSGARGCGYGLPAKWWKVLFFPLEIPSCFFGGWWVPAPWRVPCHPAVGFEKKPGRIPEV